MCPVPGLDMSSGQLWLLASTAPCTHDSFAETNPLVPFSMPSQALNKLKRVRGGSGELGRILGGGWRQGLVKLQEELRRGWSVCRAQAEKQFPVRKRSSSSEMS